jgi:hypothetical protein
LSQAILQKLIHVKLSDKRKGQLSTTELVFIQTQDFTEQEKTSALW